MFRFGKFIGTPQLSFGGARHSSDAPCGGAGTPLIAPLEWRAPSERRCRLNGIRSNLDVEQPLFALDTPGVARERAVVAHDAMAGNGDSELVRGACAGDGPHGLGRADPRAISA